MAVLLAQTREELRVSIGYNLGAVYVSTMTSSGSSTTFVDATLEQVDDYINGFWFVGTSGSNDGEIRPINDFTGSSGTGTIRGDALASTADGDTYEVWDKDMPPHRLHDFINRAIRMMPRKASPPSTDLSLHSSREIRLYDVPTDLVGIEEIWYRAAEDREDIDNCDAAWSESKDNDVEIIRSEEDKREGSASNKFEIADGLGAGDMIATQDISTKDLTGMTHIEGWLKTDTAITAGQLQIILSTTANAGTAKETLNIPAISDTRTWTRFRIAMSNPEDCSAIISVGLKYTADIGAAIVHLDGVEATQNDSGQWERLHWNLWDIDRDQRKIRFTPEAAAHVGHSALKLAGRKKPAILSADATSCDIEPEWIIQKTSALAMRARSDRTADQRQAAMLEAERYDVLAAFALRKIQGPGRIRWVDD